MKQKSISEIARMGGTARWAKVKKEDRSKIMKKVSKARKIKK